MSRAVTHRLWLGGLCRSRKVGVLVARIRDFGVHSRVHPAAPACLPADI